MTDYRIPFLPVKPQEIVKVNISKVIDPTLKNQWDLLVDKELANKKAPICEDHKKGKK